jgi:hypothetical protein
MKKLPGYIILFVVLTLMLAGCKKDPKESRGISIINKWRVTEIGDSYYLAGNLVLNQPSIPVPASSADNIAFLFNSDGTFSKFIYLNEQYILLESSNKYTLTDANNTLNLYSNSTSFVDSYKVSFTNENTMVLTKTYTYNTPTGIETPTLSAKFDLYKKIYTFTKQ